MSPYIIDIFQVLSAIASSIYLYKYKNSFLKYICAFLWYNALNDLLVLLYLDKILKETDYLYNIHQIISFSLIYWILINCINNSKRLQIIKALFSVYVIAQLIDIFTKNFITDYLPLSYFTGGFVSLLGIMYYAIELLKSQDVIPLRKDLTVWYLMGNLIFWIGYLPIYIIFNFSENLSNDLIDDLRIIKFIFIILQNSIFILGFIWSEKRN